MLHNTNAKVNENDSHLYLNGANMLFSPSEGGPAFAAMTIGGAGMTVWLARNGVFERFWFTRQ